jgi:uncharacterized membrane protein YeaQ/YmgE (transglycosylase-associated protein family)
MTILAWIIFGALAGWIASIIMRTDAEQGALGNIIVGILGAIIGGFLVQINLGSLLVAILGSIILLAIVRGVRGGRTHHHV